MQERDLPVSSDMERSVAGQMLTFPDEAVRPVLEAGGAKLFAVSYLIPIVRAIDHLYEEGEAIDQLTVGEQLKKMNEFDEAGGDTADALCLSVGVAEGVIVEVGLQMLWRGGTRVRAEQPALG